MSKENKTTVDILLELVLGYRKHTDKMYEWLDNLKASNQELREALGNPVCVVKKPKPRTNFDKITENEGALAKLIIDTVSQCQFNNCEYCPLYDVEGCSRQEKVIEWLQKECKE